MPIRWLIVLLAIAASFAAHAEVLTAPVELVDGLATGKVVAQFWGGGDTGVNGVIARGEGGPREVDIKPGTQFWAQYSGGLGGGGRQGQQGGGLGQGGRLGQQGGGLGGGLGGGQGGGRAGQTGQAGGRQGQTALGSTSVDLSRQRYAQVWIPTACTNINLPAPTQQDQMYAFVCPNPDMERLSKSLDLSPPARPIIQVAVWAIANDPTPVRVASYVRQQARASSGALTPDAIMTGAGRLLQAAGLDPASYRMFR